MNWPVTKNKLLEAAQKIKQNKFLDATVEGLLAQIPVVGNFASRYWSIIEGDDATKAEILSRFLETAAQQEEQFQNLTALIDEQGEILLQNRASLDDILIQLSGIGRKLDDLTNRFDFIFQHLKVRTVSDAFATSVSLEEDRRKADDLISEAEKVLEEAGVHAEPNAYYQLGMLYLTLNRFENAEASFLAASDANPEMGKAYLGLGMTYQLHANEMIRHENFGLAEEDLNKAESYVMTALHHNSADPAVHVYLGYIHKELAQRYAGTRRDEKAEASLEKATNHFKMALGIDENNASAHNGLGSVYIVRGDYDNAIKESGKATELDPRYLFAFHDLALAYYGKAQAATTELDRAKAFEGFLDAYEGVVRLDGDPAVGSLAPAARQNISDIGNWVLQETKNSRAAL